MPTQYLFKIREPHARRVEIDVEADTGGAASLEFRMPVWTPGSYLVREHQRHVDGVTASDESGRALGVDKIDKQTWRVRCAGASRVRVSYRLACHELTVRTNHVDATHAFLNPSASCMFVVGRENVEHRVRLEMPATWRAFVALPERDGAFVAADFDELVDSPFELGPEGAHERYPFTAQGVPHELVVWGRGDFDGQRAVADIIKIIDAEAAWFGGLPYKKPYLFILHLNDRGRGGLEHRQSCALLATRFSFGNREGYEDFLQLVAHEFFHLWNVKRLRPAAFTPYDWTRENHSTLLWAMEGLTRTYEIVALRRAGLVDGQRWLEHWAELLTQLQRTPGRKRVTLLQASYDAWIKFYRPDETTQNTTVSYYLKGGVVGMLLDLELRKRTDGKRSLDDVMRLLWERYGARGEGLPEDGVERAAVEVCGEASLQAWLDRALRSTDELPLDEALAAVGLRAVVHAAAGADDKGSAAARAADLPKPSTRAWVGAQLKEQSGALAVSAVVEGGPAQAAGLAAGDEIVAIDNYRAELKQRLSKAAVGAKLKLSVFRMDELIELQLQPAPQPLDTVTLAPVESATPRQLELRRAWIGEEWPKPPAQA